MSAINDFRTRGWRWSARTTLLALLAVTLGACDGKWVYATAQFDRTFEFTFDGTGSVTEIATLTRSDIEGDLDIPDEAVLEYVDVQRVKLTLTPGAGNEASAATLRFVYQAQGFSGDVDIAVANVASDPIDDLVANALRAVESDLQAMLGNDPSAPSQVTMEGQAFSLAPDGSRLVLEVTMSTTYYTCVEIGLGPFGPEPDCVTSGGVLGG